MKLLFISAWNLMITSPTFCFSFDHVSKKYMFVLVFILYMSNCTGWICFWYFFIQMYLIFLSKINIDAGCKFFMSILKSWDVDTKNFVCLPLIKKLAVFQPAWSFVWHNLVNGNLKLCQVIVSTGDWLWKPANIKVENSGAVVYVGSSLTMHNPLFLVHKLWLNKLTWHFYWSVSSKW